MRSARDLDMASQCLGKACPVLSAQGLYMSTETAEMIQQSRNTILQGEISEPLCFVEFTVPDSSRHALRVYSPE